MRTNQGPVDLSADAVALVAELASWQRDHSRATLSEIEDAVDAHLAPLRQHLVEAQIQAHALADDARSDAQWVCPDCGGGVNPKGKKARILRTDHGGAITLERSYRWCPRCRAGLFPPG